MRRKSHELFTGLLVLDEIAAGEPEMARRRLDIMAGVSIVDLTPAAEALAETILRSGILPASADSDAAHIALATVQRMDILLTWNCRHIANAVIEVQIRRLLRAQGFEVPTIATPEELLGDIYD